MGAQRTIIRERRVGFRVYDRRMDPRPAFVQGVRRLWRARVLLLVAFAASIAFASLAGAPFAFFLGPASRTVGLGLGVVLDGMVGDDGSAPARAVILVSWFAASIVVLGALLTGVAAAQPAGLRRCLAAGAAHFPPMLRLSLVVAAIVATTVAVDYATGLMLSLPFLFVVSLVAGYAEVRLVAEGRRSALGALLAGARFVRSNPGVTLQLHLLNSLPLLMALLLGSVLAPSYPSFNGRAWLEPWGLPVFAFLLVVAQAHWAASQMALFQERLGASLAGTSAR